MKLIRLKIIKRDAAKCSIDYASLYSCLVATAIKRRFKIKQIAVGGGDVTIAGTTYYFSTSPVHNAYRQIRRSRKSFKPFTLVLKP